MPKYQKGNKTHLSTIAFVLFYQIVRPKSSVCKGNQRNPTKLWLQPPSCVRRSGFAPPAVFGFLSLTPPCSKSRFVKKPFVKSEKSLFETACLPYHLPMTFCPVLRVVFKKRFTSKKGLRKCVTVALQLFFFRRFQKHGCQNRFVCRQSKIPYRCADKLFFNLRFKKTPLTTPLRRVGLLLQSVFVLCIGLRLRNFCFAQK